MMKQKLKIVISVILIVFLLFIVLTGIFICNSCKPQIAPQKYTSYQCYDYHLKCFKVQKKFSMQNLTYSEPYGEEETRESSWRVTFGKIAGESDDQFVYAAVLIMPLLGPADRVIMQNPDNYIDVLHDWSIDKVELYFIDLMETDEGKGSAPSPTAVLSSTSETACLSDFLRFVDSADDTWEKVSVPEGYSRADKKDGAEGWYRIRVRFKESDNIVWETDLYTFYSPTEGEKILYVDGGRRPESISAKDAKYVNICAHRDEYPDLFAWIYDAMAAVDAS